MNGVVKQEVLDAALSDAKTGPYDLHGNPMGHEIPMVDASFLEYQDK